MKLSKLLLAISACAIFSPALAANHPNIVFIIADDLRNQLPIYDHPEVIAPNITKLAKSGITFAHAYCQYPLCNPSRISILTSLRPDETKIFDNETKPHRIEGVTLMPAFFHEHGYETVRVGKIAHSTFENFVKWDEVLKPPTAKARGEEESPYKGDSDTFVNEQGATTRPAYWKFHREPLRDDEMIDGQSARKAAEFISSSHDKPIFLAVGFHRPHFPLVAPAKYFDLYPPAKIPLPNEPANDRADIPTAALLYPWYPFVQPSERRAVQAAYDACTTYIDAQVGVILDALEKSKQIDNTIIVLTSDHGIMLGEHGVMYKQMLFEECCRVPLVIRSPGCRAGAVSGSIFELIDLYPTLTELAGLPQPEKAQGIGQALVMKTPTDDFRSAAFTEIQKKSGDGRTIRTMRWRYTQWNGAKDGEELYDHDNDPHEYRNLAGESEFAGTRDDLKKQLEQQFAPKPPAR